MSSRKLLSEVTSLVDRLSSLVVRTFTDYTNVDFLDCFEEDVSESLARALSKFKPEDQEIPAMHKVHTAFFAFNAPQDEFEDQAIREMEELLAPKIEARSKQSSASAAKNKSIHESSVKKTTAQTEPQVTSFEQNQTILTRSSKKVTPVKAVSSAEKQMPSFAEPSPTPDPFTEGALHKRPPEVSVAKGKSSVKKKGKSRGASQERSAKKIEQSTRKEIVDPNILILGTSFTEKVYFWRHL